jgi:DNA-binding transcriptional LysR family regulator
MMFDWGEIRVFLAVAGEGSTLAASRKLNLNQTTVSRRIQALERALNLTLFVRDTRGYSLTAQGSALIDVAGQLGAAADNVELRAEHLARASLGKIKITAAHASMDHWVLPLISEFRKRNPDIFFETNSRESYVSLEDGEADIAIRAGDTIEGDTLIVRRLSRVKWGVYCSQRYLAEFGMPNSVDALINHPVLSYPKQMVENVNVMRWLHQFVDPARIVSEVDSVVTMSSSLRNEDAVGLLPCVEGDPLADLVRCFTHDELRSGLWMVASKEAYQEPRVRKFMKFFADNFPKDGASTRR